MAVMALLLLLSPAFAQQAADTTPRDYNYYLELLDSSKNLQYQQTLQLYEGYIAKHPADYLVQLNRCRFMEYAFSNEEYSPNYEEAELCYEELEREFPRAPEVMINKAERSYGDSVIPFCMQAITAYNENQWQGKEVWKVYERLARAYADDDQYAKAIEYGLMVGQHNDTLDNTLFLARQYKALSQNTKAVELLMSKGLDVQNKWELGQKANLLLELGKPKEAVKLYRLIEKDTTVWLNNADVAQALIRSGMYSDARVYLARSVQNSYMGNESLWALFDFDLKYGRADSAAAAYRQLTHDGLSVDPFGINRIRLFFKAPLAAWSLYDAARVVCLLLLTAFLLFSPYIWIMPMKAAADYFKAKGMYLPEPEFRWNVKHLWAAIGLLTALVVFIVLYFEHGTFEANNTLLNEKGPEMASFALAQIIGSAVITLVLLNREDITKLAGNFWPVSRSVLTGIGLAFGLRLLLGWYVVIARSAGFDILGTSSSSILAVTKEILSINEFYSPWLGFAMVVILVPFYEEILFRGVILTACQRYMKFPIANVVQSALFAALHMDLKLFPFFFAMAFIAGHYRQKSQSLAPGISMHITNNVVAFLGTLALSNT